jgi:hypothetical protein
VDHRASNPGARKVRVYGNVHDLRHFIRDDHVAVDAGLAPVRWTIGHPIRAPARGASTATFTIFDISFATITLP